jgi:solute carrier family 10 (sodium/bile acid cotransporter), member 7
VARQQCSPHGKRIRPDRQLDGAPLNGGGWLLRHWFLLGLAAAAGLAFLVPGMGAAGGPLRPEITTRVAVAIIFLVQGLSITPAALRTGALRWRLHLTVQLFIFLAFPLTMLVLDALGGRLLPGDLRLGFLLLAILPTTVSACVVYTATAGGNTAGALFNAIFANVTGVLITPLWAAALLSARGEAQPLGPMIGEIGLLLLAPLVLGQLLRPLLMPERGGPLGPRPPLLSVLPSLMILYIVFAAFARSVESEAFDGAGAPALLVVAVVAVLLFLLATSGAVVLGRRLGFDRGDRTALIFCGPQKTLAAGVPMAQVLFAGNPGLGLILLPLMLYHAVQLAGGAPLIGRLAIMNRAEARAGAD